MAAAARRRPASTGRRLLTAIRTAPRRFWARVGHRGGVLLALGWLEVTYGYQIITDVRYGVVRGTGVLQHLAPMPYWGAVWIAAGMVALFMSVEMRTTRDTIGYGVAFVPLALWSVANLYACTFGGYPEAYTSAATWGLFAAITVMVNRWLGAARVEGPHANGPG